MAREASNSRRDDLEYAGDEKKEYSVKLRCAGKEKKEEIQRCLEITFEMQLCSQAVLTLAASLVGQSSTWDLEFMQMGNRGRMNELMIRYLFNGVKSRLSTLLTGGGLKQRNMT